MPTTGMVCCCARAASAHEAAAPLTNVMNSRRLIVSPDAWDSMVSAEISLLKGAHVRFGSKADIGSAARRVRFAPKADIASATRHVRFTPNSGHSQA